MLPTTLRVVKRNRIGRNVSAGRRVGDRQKRIGVSRGASLPWIQILARSEFTSRVRPFAGSLLRRHADTFLPVADTPSLIDLADGIVYHRQQNAQKTMAELFGQRWSRAELERRIGHISQLGGVRLLALDNGPSRGVRLIEFRTGTGFMFEVALDRGMDVGRAEYRGASLAWMPPTLMPGPWYFEQQTEFGWLRTALGGFNNTCGLIHIGNPETAEVGHYNFPARP